MENVIIYDKLGKKTGFYVSPEDMKYRPLSECRAELAWIHSGGEIRCFEWKLEDPILIPFKDFLKMCEIENDGEPGLELLKRYLEINK